MVQTNNRVVCVNCVYTWYPLKKPIAYFNGIEKLHDDATALYGCKCAILRTYIFYRSAEHCTQVHNIIVGYELWLYTVHRDISFV